MKKAALSFTNLFGKFVCVVLYAAFAALAVKGVWIPLAALAALHFSEYFIAAHKVAKANGINQLSAFLNCLCFGFTWWLPIKNGYKF